MPKHRLLGVVVTAMVALSTSGCGPVYRTHYSYAPPTEMAGRHCITQCDAIREMCRATAENRAAQERASCRQNATLRYAACMATAKESSDRNACSSSAYCDTRADTDHCELDYNRCYQDCGGTVDARRICVSGC
jgi:hypothetical protein